MLFRKWAEEIAEELEAASCDLAVDFAVAATPIINAALERRLAGKSYWADPKTFGRVWAGPFAQDSTMHYGYTDGEVLPNGDLCWTLARSAPPGTSFRRISEAEAIALLISRKWPNITTEGWDHAKSTLMIAAFLYRQSVKVQCA